MDDGIGDIALVHHHADGPGYAQHQRPLEDVFAAVHKEEAGAAGGKAADDPRPHRHQQEDAGHLRHVPAEADGAADVHPEQQDDVHRRQFLSVIQGLPPLHRDVLLPLQVRLVAAAQLRVLRHPGGVAHDVDQGDDVEHHEADGPVPQAGVKGQAANLLADQGGEGVAHTGGKANAVAADDHGAGGDGIEPQPQDQGKDDGQKDDAQFRHPQKGIQHGKTEEQDGDGQVAVILEPVAGHLHRRRDDSQPVDDPEGAPHRHGHEQQGRHRLEAVGEGRHQLHGTHRGPLHMVEAVGVHHLAAAHRVGDHLIGAGRKEVGEHRHQQDDTGQKDEHMGELPLFSLVFPGVHLLTPVPRHVPFSAPGTAAPRRGSRTGRTPS